MKKILIIEDSPIVAEMIKFQINEEHYSIQSCNKIDDIKSYNFSDFDVILLDHHLGNLNGVEYTGFMLIDEIKLETDLIVISGQTDPNIAIDYIQKGALTYLNKDNPDFLNEIEKILNSIIEDNSPLAKLNIQKETLNNITSLYITLPNFGKQSYK